MLDTAQTVLFKWLPPQLCAASNPIFVASWRQPPRGQFWAQGGSFDFVNGPMEVSPRLLQNPMYLRSRNFQELICRGMTNARISRDLLHDTPNGILFWTARGYCQAIVPCPYSKREMPGGLLLRCVGDCSGFQIDRKEDPLDEVKNVKNDKGWSKMARLDLNG